MVVCEDRLFRFYLPLLLYLFFLMVNWKNMVSRRVANQQSEGAFSQYI